MADHEGADLVIHGTDGKTPQDDSDGNDPVRGATS